MMTFAAVALLFAALACVISCLLSLLLFTAAAGVSSGCYWLTVAACDCAAIAAAVVACLLRKPLTANNMGHIDDRGVGNLTMATASTTHQQQRRQYDNN